MRAFSFGLVFLRGFAGLVGWHIFHGVHCFLCEIGR